MPKKLLQGAGVSLATESGKAVRRLLIGATWSHTDVDVDMCALLCEHTGGSYKVPSSQYFLFRNRRATPERAGFLTYLPPSQVAGPDRAQILLDLERLDPGISRVVIAMSALRQGGVLSEMGTLRTRAMDLDSGETLYVYQHAVASTLNTQCITLWTLDRRAPAWEGRVTALSHPGGPPALVRDYGAA